MIEASGWFWSAGGVALAGLVLMVWASQVEHPLRGFGVRLGLSQFEFGLSMMALVGFPAGWVRTGVWGFFFVLACFSLLSAWRFLQEQKRADGLSMREQPE